MKIMHRILSTFLMTAFVSFGAAAGTSTTTFVAPVEQSADVTQLSSQAVESSRQLVQYGGGGGASPPDPKPDTTIVPEMCVFGICAVKLG